MQFTNQNVKYYGMYAKYKNKNIRPRSYNIRILNGCEVLTEKFVTMV